jgi:hypothetical protein
MAQVDIIKVDGQDMYLMNVTQPVGPNYGGPEDVMLVKALLEGAFDFWGWRSYIIVSPPTSGTFDKTTQDNIKIYQKKFNEWMTSSGNQSRLTVDGRVSRARGQYSWDKSHPWTITTLNTIVGIHARNWGLNSAADHLVSAYPHLAQILKIDPNTL